MNIANPTKPAPTTAPAPKAKHSDLRKASMSGNEKISLISNLSTMLGAGIPILESVESLLEDAKGGQKKLLETMHEDLMQGQPMHATFEKFPKIFDKVTVNIIKASEEAGTLDETLKDLKTTIKSEMEFNDRIKSAMIYPSFIVVVFVAVLLMILVVVVPKISTVFVRLRTPLPLPTKVLIFLSNGLLHNTIAVVIAAIALIAGGFLIFKSQKRAIIGLLLKLPVLNILALQIDLTHFTRSFYLLLNAGIPITQALELTHEVVVTKKVADAVAHAKDVVSGGKKLSEAFRDEKKVFPTIVIKMVEAGEKSGSLDKAMQEAAEYLDYQVSGTLKTATSLIEPLMLVFVGGMIGAMMLAIIAPIYGLIGQVGSPH